MASLTTEEILLLEATITPRLLEVRVWEAMDWELLIV
jgi:hypothetical protein